MAELTGRVEAVLCMSLESSPVSIPQERIDFDWAGVIGDKHAGLTMRAGESNLHHPPGVEVRNTWQISLSALEELAEVAAALGVAHVEPGWIGANVALSGIPRLSSLPAGSRIYLGEEAVLVLSEANTPCTSSGAAIQEYFPEAENIAGRFPKAAYGKRGVYAWVERPGTLRGGDTVRIVT